MGKFSAVCQDKNADQYLPLFPATAGLKQPPATTLPAGSGEAPAVMPELAEKLAVWWRAAA